MIYIYFSASLGFLVPLVIERSKVPMKSKAEKEILSTHSFFSKINYPYQSLDTGIKEYLNSFFDRGLVDLCDRIFGRLEDTNFNVEENPCWMDLANNSPSSSMASSLFQFLVPSSPFIHILESLSSPLNDFPIKLKKSWKPNVTGNSEATSLRYTINFPLSLFCRNSASILYEPDDSNLYNMPQSRFPPLLLFPFWVPPLSSRGDNSSKNVVVYLPCLPLPYFILRMVYYVMIRCERDAARIISKRALGVYGWICYLRDQLLSYFLKKGALDFPFYYRILTAFIQFYTTPTLFQNTSKKLSLEGNRWIPADVIAAVLFCSPTVFSQRDILQPSSEWCRSPNYNLSTVAKLLCTIPVLTESFINIYAHKSTQYPLSLNDREIQKSSTYNLTNDIVEIYSSFYRSSLVSLRVCLLSLNGFSFVRRAHLNNLLELWLTLMNPLSRKSQLVDECYMISHFEVYTCITFDMLQLFTKGSFLEDLDGSGVSLFARCLEILSSPSCKRLFTLLQKELDTNNIFLFDTILTYRVLDWGTNQDAFLDMLNFNNPKTSSLAACLYVILDRKLASCKRYDIKEHLEMCIQYVTLIFPMSDGLVKKCREMLSSYSQKKVPFKNVASFFSNTLTNPNVSESCKNKSLLAPGHRPALRLNHVRFSVKSGNFYFGHYISLNTTMHQEFPILVGLSIFMDMLLNKVTELLFYSKIQKCDNGHRLWFVASRNHRCSNHYAEMGIWECGICEKIYGTCCRSGPTMNFNAEVLYVCNDFASRKTCSWCEEMLQPSHLFFTLHDRENFFLCATCASYPFKPWRTRWIAAYQTWAILIFVFFPLIVYFCVHF